ncbi:hypothetical protein C8R45DRAFT_1095110 [Mycena sanguinolenta]|nr:hypothetical protein C8R45DRAFT_1095110 [Mycena sanguinolenta]
MPHEFQFLHQPLHNDLPTPACVAQPSSSLSAAYRNKRKSKAWRDRKRCNTRTTSNNPLIKQVHHKCLNSPHTQTASVNTRFAEEAELEGTEAAPAPELGDGLGRPSYTQEQVDALTGASGLTYIPWLGQLTIPIINRQRCICGVLGRASQDTASWKSVTDGAFSLLEEWHGCIHLPDDQLHHRRVQEPFLHLHAVAKQSPGSSVTTSQTHSSLMSSSHTSTSTASPILRIAILFAVWAPLLFAFYQAQMALLSSWKSSMQKNFTGSVFVTCTFNSRLHTVCAPHLDFANLAWGWCAITALGDLDPDVGGHLILWDLHLVIRFPPGSTIPLPLAIVHHSNMPIRVHGVRATLRPENISRVLAEENPKHK